MDNGRRTALITGGTKGLGRAIAGKLLSAGFDVFLTYASDVTSAAQTEQELTQRFPGLEIKTIKADITKLESISFIQESVGALDALVLNAGITDRTDFTELKQESWTQVLDANLTYPVFLIQALLPKLKRGSSIVFTGSLMGIHPHSLSLAYGTTKAATHALTKNLVKVMAPHEIRVNAVAPGFIDTEWQKNKPKEIRASIESKISCGKFAEPQDVARVYLELIDNPYLNGEVIIVDGGYSFK